MTHPADGVEPGATDESPAVSVVIPTYNRADTVLVAVESVLSQEDITVDVVVVDDGSTDDTRERLASVGDERLTLVVQQNRGRCAARNAGARRATSDWLVFLDSDDELLPGSLARFAGAAASGPELVVGLNRRLEPSGATRPGKPLWNEDDSLPIGFQAGAFAIRRDVFDRIGGYCEAIRHSEHTEMAYRIRGLEPEPVAVRLGIPTVLIHERPRQHDPRLNYETATHLVEHLAAEFADDPVAMSTYLDIAGVAAGRLGRRREACRLLVRSMLIRPRVRTLGRLVRAAVQPSGGTTSAGATSPAESGQSRQEQR